MTLVRGMAMRKMSCGSLAQFPEQFPVVNFYLLWLIELKYDYHGKLFDQLLLIHSQAVTACDNHPNIQLNKAKGLTLKKSDIIKICD